MKNAIRVYTRSQRKVEDGFSANGDVLFRNAPVVDIYVNPVDIVFNDKELSFTYVDKDKGETRVVYPAAEVVKIECPEEDYHTKEKDWLSK